MTEKIDLSLDEIIKINKKQNSNKLRTNKAAQSKIRPKIQRTPQQQQQPIKDAGQTMLHVSNLHFKVSNKDLKELFEDIGPIKKAAVHYDKSGRSLGTAEVIFRTREAAIRAIKKYNQRILDGRPMNITLVPSNSPTKSIGIKPGSGIHKRSQQQVNRRSLGPNKSPRKGNLVNKGNRKGKIGSQRQPKKEVTAEQLDADLEAYTMNVD